MPKMPDFMGQVQKMQERVLAMQEELGRREVEGSAGGGMVKVTANGRQEIVRLAIDPQVVDPADVSMLEDLIVAAAADARRKSQELAMEEMKKVTGGLPMPPGLFG